MQETLLRRHASAFLLTPEWEKSPLRGYEQPYPIPQPPPFASLFYNFPSPPPQPSSTRLRTAFGANANRPRPNLGSSTPLFAPFYKNVKAILSLLLEPSLGCVRLLSPLRPPLVYPKLGSNPFCPATEIGESPHRVWVKRGAERGRTRLREIKRGRLDESVKASRNGRGLAKGHPYPFRFLVKSGAKSVGRKWRERLHLSSQ